MRERLAILLIAYCFSLPASGQFWWGGGPVAGPSQPGPITGGPVAAVAAGPSFSGGDISYESLYDAAVAMVAATDTPNPGDTTGGTLTINGVALGSYDFHKVTGNQTVSSFTSSDWFTSEEDDRWAFVVVDGDLTINSGQTFIPANRKLGTVIYATGAVVVDGTVSMTARGANHSSATGSNVSAGVIRIITGTYGGVTNPDIPAAGGAGGAAVSGVVAAGNTGSAGSAGGSGGGGSGAASGGTSGGGTAGSSYSGGTGGGGESGGTTAGSGEIDGAAGGDGAVSASINRGAGGGAGNPGGAGASFGTGVGSPGANGTGGVLVFMAEGVLSGSGSIHADGAAGGDATGLGRGGGGSGGGSVTVLVGSGSGPTVQANGGAGGIGASNSGGAGGAGTARLLTGL